MRMRLTALVLIGLAIALTRQPVAADGPFKLLGGAQRLAQPLPKAPAEPMPEPLTQPEPLTPPQLLTPPAGPPPCEPGFQMVEEVTYQEVKRTVCKMVPEIKKKWVYDCIDDPFCIPSKHHGDCAGCAGPLCRKLLVKRQVELPCPIMKCVAETITEQVPCVTYKKVPITTVPPSVAPPPLESIRAKPLPPIPVDKK